MDDLVQFEEDFNSWTEMWWWGFDRLCQTRPDHLTVIIKLNQRKLSQMKPIEKRKNTEIFTILIHS